MQIRYNLRQLNIAWENKNINCVEEISLAEVKYN